MKKAILTMTMVIACGAGAAHAQAPVADYFSVSSTMDNDPIPTGTMIEAYDSNGIRCGFAEANFEGGFLIHVYGNDPFTPSIDEGAQEGEMLEWRMNGAPLDAASAIWVANIIGAFPDIRWENGAAKEIRLDRDTTAVETNSWTEMKERFGR